MYLIFLLLSCSDVFDNAEVGMQQKGLQSLFYDESTVQIRPSDFFPDPEVADVFGDYAQTYARQVRNINLTQARNARRVAKYLIKNTLSEGERSFLYGKRDSFQSQLVIDSSELVQILQKNPTVGIDTLKKFFTYKFSGSVEEFSKFIESHKDIVLFSPGELKFVPKKNTSFADEIRQINEGNIPLFDVERFVSVEEEVLATLREMRTEEERNDYPEFHLNQSREERQSQLNEISILMETLKKIHDYSLTYRVNFSYIPLNKEFFAFFSQLPNLKNIRDFTLVPNQLAIMSNEKNTQYENVEEIVQEALNTIYLEKLNSLSFSSLDSDRIEELTVFNLFKLLEIIDSNKLKLSNLSIINFPVNNNFSMLEQHKTSIKKEIFLTRILKPFFSKVTLPKLELFSFGFDYQQDLMMENYSGKKNVSLIVKKVLNKDLRIENIGFGPSFYLDNKLAASVAPLRTNIILVDVLVDNVDLSPEGIRGALEQDESYYSKIRALSNSILSRIYGSELGFVPVNIDR